jgi:hypothetical protein
MDLSDASEADLFPPATFVLAYFCSFAFCPTAFSPTAFSLTFPASLMATFSALWTLVGCAECSALEHSFATTQPSCLVALRNTPASPFPGLPGFSLHLLCDAEPPLPAQSTDRHFVSALSEVDRCPTHCSSGSEACTLPSGLQLRGEALFQFKQLAYSLPQTSFLAVKRITLFGDT